MGLIDALILALIQGLTEFLPVSSSGHLALMQYFLEDFSQPGIAYDVLLHVATLLSVLIYFRKDITRLTAGFFRPGSPSEEGPTESSRKMVLWLIIASVPTGILGLYGRDVAKKAFGSIVVVGVMLMLTGLALAATFFRKNKGVEGLNWYKAVLIGIAQGAAILPGISRSGLTISTGIYLDTDREYAARFSFLLSVPAILGALILEGEDIIRLFTMGSGPLAVHLAGAIVAFVSGLIAIHAVLKLVASRRFEYFAFYCLPLGAAVTVLGLVL